MMKISPAKLWAIGLGFAVAATTWCCAPSLLEGRLWQPLSEAALLRPPEHLLPGLWRLLVYACVRSFGLQPTITVLTVAGPLALGYVAYRAASGIHTVLELVLRTDRCPPWFAKVQIPVLVVSGVAFLVCSWPFFQSAWMLTPQLLTLVLLFTVFGLIRRFLLGSSIFCGSLGIFLTGLMAAEGLLGWFVLIAVVISCFVRTRTDVTHSFILSNPASYNIAKWVATIIFFVGFGGLLTGNLWFFLHHGGMPSVRLAEFVQGAGADDVAIAFGLVIAPFVLTLAMLPRATDTAVFLSYARGMCLLVCGIMSFSFLLQPGLVEFPDETVTVLLRYLATFTLIAVLTAVIVEVCCRNHLSVFVARYDAEGAEAADREAFRFPLAVRRSLCGVFVAVLLALTAWSVCSDGARTLAVELDHSAQEILDEATGLDRLFTDGHFDALLELESARRGHRLVCHSLFGDGPYAALLRQRDVTGEDDYAAMARGASVALSHWVQTGSPELAKSGVMIGFEFWQPRAGRAFTRPVPGGYLARPAGYGEAAALAEAHRRAEALAARADAPRLTAAYARCCDKRLKNRYDALKWRVARLFQLRAQQADREGRVEEGTRLLALARALDVRNESLEGMRTFLGLICDQAEMQFTPSECLSIYLKRPDFKAARPHAEAVLASNAGDPEAHWALGMYHLENRNFERAELHLAQALAASPDAPHLLNNLAIVRLHLGQLESALELSDRALALKPAVEEIRATNLRIRRQLADQAQE